MTAPGWDRYPHGYSGAMAAEREILSAPLVVDPSVAVTVDAVALERRGRWWLILSFLACPCHLPWTLALLGTVLGGTALGAALREHTLLAGVIVASVWIAGTARGLLLVRRAERGELACGVPKASRSTGVQAR